MYPQLLVDHDGAQQRGLERRAQPASNIAATHLTPRQQLDWPIGDYRRSGKGYLPSAAVCAFDADDPDVRFGASSPHGEGQHQLRFRKRRRLVVGPSADRHRPDDAGPPTRQLGARPPGDGTDSSYDHCPRHDKYRQRRFFEQNDHCDCTIRPGHRRDLVRLGTARTVLRGLPHRAHAEPRRCHRAELRCSEVRNICVQPVHEGLRRTRPRQQPHPAEATHHSYRPSHPSVRISEAVVAAALEASTPSADFIGSSSATLASSPGTAASQADHSPPEAPQLQEAAAQSTTPPPRQQPEQVRDSISPSSSLRSAAALRRPAAIGAANATSAESTAAHDAAGSATPHAATCPSADDPARTAAGYHAAATDASGTSAAAAAVTSRPSAAARWSSRPRPRPRPLRPTLPPQPAVSPRLSSHHAHRQKGSCSRSRSPQHQSSRTNSPPSQPSGTAAHTTASPGELRSRPPQMDISHTAAPQGHDRSSKTTQRRDPSPMGPHACSRREPPARPPQQQRSDSFEQSPQPQPCTTQSQPPSTQQRHLRSTASHPQHARPPLRRNAMIRIRPDDDWLRRITVAF